MSDSIMAFQGKLAEFIEKVKVKKELVMKKVSQELWTGITERTPVDTGRARANWFLTTNSPSQEVKEFKGAKTGEVPAPPPPDISAIDGNEDVFIINNLVYIEPLEHGHSKKAPGGMVKLAMQEVAARIDNAVNAE